MKIKKLLYKIKAIPGRIPMNILYYHMLWLNKKISAEKYIKMVYFIQFKKKLNLDNPKTFNEKLNWIKLYDQNPKYTKMVDKLAVRDYIREVLGEEYIIPLLGVYDKFDDIDFDTLPEQFVIKTNHDSAGYVICKDKTNFDVVAAKAKIDKHLKNNYYWMGREWPYKNVEPKVIIEKYMQDREREDLFDWKFYCANGKPFLFYAGFDRSSKQGLSINYYTMDGEKIPVRHCNYPNHPSNLELPQNFDEMIKVAEKLSADIPFVRVDMYNIGGKIYFGELTFFPGCGIGGLKPTSYDELWGDYIRLPEKLQEVQG